MKRNFKKAQRILALLMMLVIVFSSFPVSAFAAEADNSQQIRQDGGTVYYDAYGNPVAASSLGDKGSVVSLSKTIAPTKNENYFDITLQVETFQKMEELTKVSNTAVVIVMDISNTMNTEETRNGKKISKLTDAKAAAQAFVDEYAKEAISNSTLGFVTFNRNAQTVFGLTDISKATTAQLNNLKNQIGNIDAPGGNDRWTNIEGGLKLAQNLLAGSSAEHKYVILLTDGFPTTYIYGDKTSATKLTGYQPFMYRVWQRGTGWYSSVDSSVTPIADRYLVNSGKDSDVGKDGYFYDSVEKAWCIDGVDYSDKGAIRARQIAESIKSSGINIFSIGVGVDKMSINEYDKKTGSSYNTGYTPVSTLDRTGSTYEIGTASSSEGYKKWLGTKIGGGAALQASDAWNATYGAYTNAASGSQLTKIFQDVLGSIKEVNEIATAGSWVGSDPMNTSTGSKNIEFLGFYGKDGYHPFNTDGSHNLDGENTKNGENTATIKKQYDSIEWDLMESGYKEKGSGDNKTYTYTLTYRVRLANEIENFAEETALDTNGTTTLTYKVIENGVTSPDRTGEFPVPKVEGYLGEFSFSKVDAYRQSEYLSDATFSLTHNANCSVCGGAVAINIDPVTSGSGLGNVTFSKIPSGHDYTMREIAAPAGYKTNGTEWPVSVHYGNTVVENILYDDGGNMMVTNELNPYEETIKVIKTWANQDVTSFKGEEVVVYIYKSTDVDADGKPIEGALPVDTLTITVDTGEDSATTSQALPTVDVSTGTKIDYVVVEAASKDYQLLTNKRGTVDDGDYYTFTLTNLMQEYTNLTITKEWIAPESYKSSEDVTIRILRDGKKYADIILNDKVGWTYEATDLPFYKEDGSGDESKYTVQEIDPSTGEALSQYTVGKDDNKDSFTVTVDGLTVTNTIDQKFISLSGTKNWNFAALNEEDKANVSATIELIADGTPTGETRTVTGTDKGSWTFADLPKYALPSTGENSWRFMDDIVKDGHEIVYTAQETGVPDNYKIHTDISEDNFYTITNTLTGETEVEVTKEWLDNEDALGLRPNSITLKLLANGQPARDANGVAVAPQIIRANWIPIEPEIEPAAPAEEPVVDPEPGTTPEVPTEEPVVTPEPEAAPAAPAEEPVVNPEPEATPAASTDEPGVTPEPEATPAASTEEPVADPEPEAAPAASTEEPAVTPESEAAPAASTEESVTTPEPEETPAAPAEEPEDPSAGTGNGYWSWEGVDLTRTFTNLPQYDATGAKIIYTVVEEGVNSDSQLPIENSPYGDYYSVVVSGNMDEGFTVTNTLNGEERSIPVAKIWNDAGLAKENGTAAIITLLADGEFYADTTLTYENPSYTFEDLPTYDEKGKLIEYTVEEAPIDGYTSTVEPSEDGGYIFTNTIKQENTVSVPVQKLWVDANMEYLPEVTVNLYGWDKDTPIDFVKLPVSADATAAVAEVLPTDVEIPAADADAPAAVDTTTEAPSTADGWSYTFTELPKYHYDENGVAHIINYTVGEEMSGDMAPHFTQNIDGYTITNTFNPGTTQMAGNKQWYAGGYEAEISVGLFQDGVMIAKQQTEDLKYSFTDLDKYKNDGSEIVYTVYELDESDQPITNNSAWGDYTVTYEGSTIINKLTQQTDITVGVTKYWDGPVPQTGGVSFIVTRSANGVPEEGWSQTIDLTIADATEDGDYVWKGSLADLERYNSAGYAYKYSVEESGVVNGTITVDGITYTSEKMGDTVNVFRNTVVDPKNAVVTVQKLWDTEIDEAAEPDEITIQLLANGVPIASATLPQAAEADPATADPAEADTTVDPATGEGPAAPATGDLWSYTFDGLDVYDVNNQPIEYTVKEAGESNDIIVLHDGEQRYKVDYAGEDGEFTITNIRTDSYYYRVFRHYEYDINGDTGTYDWNDTEWTVSYRNEVPNIDASIWVDPEGDDKDIMYTFLGDRTNVTNGENATHTFTTEDGIIVEFTVEKYSDVNYYNVYLNYYYSWYPVPPEETPEETTSLSIQKVWVGDEDLNVRPESIVVSLLENGTPTGSTASLSQDNDWQYTWSGLNTESTWSVAEVDVPDGYTAVVSGSGTSYTITNTYSNPGGGDPGDNDPGDSDPGDNEPTPEPTPEPTLPEEPVDLFDEDVPLTELLEDEVPLAALPPEEEVREREELIELLEDEVPLANVPKTGDISMMWFGSAGLSGLGMAIMSLFKRRKKD